MQPATTATASERLFGFANWLGVSDRSRGRRGYLNALIAVAIAVILQSTLKFFFDARTPTYLVFIAPIIVATLLGGVIPGLVTTVVVWAIAYFFFVEPTFEFKTGSEYWVVAGVFGAEGAAIAVGGGWLRETIGHLAHRERELAASEARLIVSQEAARIATYEWSPLTNAARWSENAEDVMAMAPGTFKGTFEDSLRTVHADDRHLIDGAVNHLMAAGSSEAEYRVLGADGLVRWVHATGTLIRGESRAGDRVLGVMMDVTDRRRAAEHDKFLADATAQLASSMDYRSNVAGLANVAVPGFSAIAGVILVRDGVFPGEVVSLRHADPQREPLLKKIQAILEESPETPGVLAKAIRSGAALFLPSIPPGEARTGAISERHEVALDELQLSAAMCIPLAARGSTLGGLIFANEDGRAFSNADYAIATELGRRASIAIENGLLLEQSFEREAEVSRKNEALQLIADAGVELSATLDLGHTLDSLANLVVPRFADVCSVSLVENGKLQPAALAAKSEELRLAVRSLSNATTQDRELYESAAQVLRSDRPIFFAEIPPSLFERLSGSEAHPMPLDGISARSIILMPLTARSQTIGVMTFLRTRDSPPFDREDLSLAGQIARRTAVSADNGRLYAEARRANDAKDEFLGMMSHELRTPITVIHGGARVLRSRGPVLDEETRAGLVGDIERESDRLSRMLENLLALARAELDREVILEPVLLQRLLPRLIGSLKTATGREVTLETAGELPAVSSEPGYIEHIVRNLVSNAVKYSPPDAPIEVCMTPSGEGASIIVLDRGFGIAPEEATRIFERFYRSDRTSRLAGGAGLGLAVCKRLVEAMSGEIWASPREGGGLEVGFSLPPYREENMEL